MRKCWKQVLFVFLALAVFSCKKDEQKESGITDPGRTDAVGAPIKPINGIVRFFVSEQEGESPRSVLLGGGTHLEAGQTIRVNGMSYALKQSDGGKLYIDVKEAADRVYVATDQSASLEEILIPYSQFQGKTRQSFKESPRYAVYTEATGNLLTLKDPMALLNLKLKGSVNVSSVKVRSLDGKGIAGKGSIQEGKLTLGDALDFAVVNCTENGSFVPLSSAGTSVGVLLAPGDYPEGFELTVCTSDHRMVRRTLPGGSLGSGEVRTESVDVTPEGDLVFYEGFDIFVWGGNWMGGEQAFGFAPDANTINPVSTLVRDGYADATVKVAYNTPGSSFIQSDVWTTVENSTVGQSHLMGKSYITSRNIADWNYLYRCQEYQGALGVGMGTAYRGILELPALRVQGMWDVRVRFKFSFRNGATDDLLFKVVNAGHITACKVDGRALPSEISYYLNTGSAVLPRARISIPATAVEPKTWHQIEITVSGVGDATHLQIAGNQTGSGVHGFFVDDIEVRTLPGSAKKGTVRLMYMNIQNGMWADQGNNYDNFVAWINRYNPDICVWCEAESLYKTGTDTYLSSSQRYLPGHWTELAARYGHSNYNGARRDDYPQAITSKYKITRVQGIGGPSDLPICHGAGHFQLTIGGRKINIVTTHLWPKKDDSYKPSVYPTGDEYREYEMKYLLSQTLNNPSYASEQDWILIGDFNSSSSLDIDTYGYEPGDKRFLAQDAVLKNTNLKDLIATWYPAPQFVQSTYGKDRRDYVYVSPSLLQTVVRASCFTDSFTPGTRTGISNFSIPSDHRPFIVDFNL